MRDYFKRDKKVHFTFPIDGDESVLLFVSALEQDYVTPVVKKLRAFKRISLNKGQTKTVTFKLNKEDFTYIDVDMKKATSKGRHFITIEGLKEEIFVG